MFAKSLYEKSYGKVWFYPPASSCRGVFEPMKKTAKGVEMVVYLVFSPESGPDYRVYSDEDILAIGGIHAIELDLEQESYWFVRLGVIRGESSSHDISFHDSEIARLLPPVESAWQTGRRNPAYSRSELGLQLFNAIFRAVQRTLDSWKREQDGTMDAYALKRLKISSERLASLMNGLWSMKQVHDVVEVTVIKYWYDPSWPEPHLPAIDLILAEFSFHVPIQLGWSSDEDLVRVGVMPISLC